MACLAQIEIHDTTSNITTKSIPCHPILQTTWIRKSLPQLKWLFHLRPREWWQIIIIQDLVQSHRSSNNKTNLLVVRSTSGGKSLVHEVAGYVIKGIILFISPLLALASNQTWKLLNVTLTTHSGNYVSLPTSRWHGIIIYPRISKRSIYHKWFPNLTMYRIRYSFRITSPSHWVQRHSDYTFLIQTTQVFFTWG